MFRRALLAMILPSSPSDAQGFRTCSDFYIVRFGQLIGGSFVFREALGCYRRHGANNFSRNGLIAARMQTGDMRRHPAAGGLPGPRAERPRGAQGGVPRRARPSPLCRARQVRQGPPGRSERARRRRCIAGSCARRSSGCSASPAMCGCGSRSGSSSAEPASAGRYVDPSGRPSRERTRRWGRRAEGADHYWGIVTSWVSLPRHLQPKLAPCGCG